MIKTTHDRQKKQALYTEHLIIGSGVAGLMLAIKLAQRQKVIVLTKSSLLESNSYFAQGGIASVLADNDTFEEHYKDTIEAGAGLCHPEVVREIVSQGPKAISDLLQLGVEFTREEGRDNYHLTREGGHSKRRVVHAKDATGQAIMTALEAKVRSDPNIRVLEQQMAIDLITSDRYAPNFSENRCLGAYVLDIKTESIYKICSEKTYLCTGGHGRLYLYTSNPPGATGDGLAMAWRAGCKVANLEFMQFHPTCLFHPTATTFLISEAVRGEGGIIRNKEGEPFVDRFHPKGSLAPRDIVARAIDYELKRSGENHVYLDVTHLGSEKIKRLFPNIYATCCKLGIDMTVEPIPIVPAAHYCCGGIVIDENGRTSLNGLFALGEVACSGLHGANRLASNSLLEACVLANKVADFSLRNVLQLIDACIPDWDESQTIPSDEQVILSHAWDEIRRVMWNYVGIVRSDARLKRALSRIEAIRQEIDEYYWSYQVNTSLLEVRNLAAVAWLTIRCAMRRKESRGIHYTLDYKEQNPLAAIDTILI